jgi:hypothetical protein
VSEDGRFVTNIDDETVADTPAVDVKSAWRLPRRWIVAEQLAYSLTCLTLVAVPIVLFAANDRNWNTVLSVFSLAITSFGAGVAVTIYRIQSLKSHSDRNDQKVLLNAIGKSADSAAKNAKSAADSGLAMSDFLNAMRTAKAAAHVPGPDDIDSSNAAQESSEVDDSSLDLIDEEPVGGERIVVPSDGEYRRPSAVPLKLIADLVDWWRRPGGSSGSWTVGNLMGAYRPFNKAGNFQGVPWILTFRRSNGELVEYRVSYSGRKRADQSRATPTISGYSETEKKWSDGDPTVHTENLRS